VIGGLLAVGLILLVAAIQQSGWSAVKAANAAPRSPAEIQPPPVLFEVIGRMYVKLSGVVASAPAGGAPGPGLAPAASEALGEMAETPEQVVRLGIVEAELGAPGAAVERLMALQASLPNDAPMAEDVDDLIELYRPQAEGAPLVPLDPLAADRLAANHGWFGRLAAAYGKPAADPVRVETAGGGPALVVFLLCFGLAVVLAILAGMVLLITGVVMAASGRLKTRFAPPAPGGSVAIETVAVFAGGFILLKVITELIGQRAASPQTALVVVLSMQWVLALAIFWPVVRGVRAREGLALFGLHRGRGVLREIGCGIVGYLACLPLFVLGALISIVLVTIQAIVQEKLKHKAEPPGNDIVDLVGRQGHSVVIVLLFVLAAVWAPLVEETIFRGALYRQLRARWRWFGAAAVSALAFGAMHGYAVLMLFPIIGLGFGFALLREWRGSTIASMTGHCIHNASALTLMLVTLRLLGM
jgi:membrane protease YdiL (CAAX protease family)